jgi:hypothetical protein
MEADTIVCGASQKGPQKGQAFAPAGSILVASEKAVRVKCVGVGEVVASTFGSARDFLVRV